MMHTVQKQHINGALGESVGVIGGTYTLPLFQEEPRGEATVTSIYLLSFVVSGTTRGLDRISNLCEAKQSRFLPLPRFHSTHQLCRTQRVTLVDATPTPSPQKSDIWARHSSQQILCHSNKRSNYYKDDQKGELLQTPRKCMTEIQTKVVQLAIVLSWEERHVQAGLWSSLILPSFISLKTFQCTNKNKGLLRAPQYKQLIQFFSEATFRNDRPAHRIFPRLWSFGELEQKS